MSIWSDDFAITVVFEYSCACIIISTSFIVQLSYFSFILYFYTSYFRLLHIFILLRNSSPLFHISYSLIVIAILLLIFPLPLRSVLTLYKHLHSSCSAHVLEWKRIFAHLRRNSCLCRKHPRPVRLHCVIFSSFWQIICAKRRAREPTSGRNLARTNVEWNPTGRRKWPREIRPSSCLVDPFLNEFASKSINHPAMNTLATPCPPPHPTRPPSFLLEVFSLGNFERPTHLKLSISVSKRQKSH